MVHVMDGLRSTLIAPFYHFFGWLISWYNGSNMILTYDFMQFIWFSCVNYSILSPPIIHDSTQLISELYNISFWSKWILYVMIRYNDSNLQICSYYFLLECLSFCRSWTQTYCDTNLYFNFALGWWRIIIFRTKEYRKVYKEGGGYGAIVKKYCTGANVKLTHNSRLNEVTLFAGQPFQTKGDVRL